MLYYDTTGGTNPKENMSVTFKAKSNITTVNPTDFMITAEGLGNSDASVVYDDISIPIKKEILENIDASVKVILKKDNKVIYSDTSLNCGLEIVKNRNYY